MKNDGPRPLGEHGFIGGPTPQERDFLARMSHELRTPLNAIAGYAELLVEDKPADDPDLEPLQGIQRASRRLLALVESVLDLNQLQTGRFEVDIRPFAIADVVAEVLEAVRDQADRSGTELHAEVADLEMRSDLRMVRQILFNLVDNAARFTREGNVWVEVGRAGAFALRIVVRDDGIGMTPAQVQAATRPFWQADATTTRRYDGAGMGLAVCRAMAESLGGNLHIESETGMGATVRVTLPIDSEPAEESPWDDDEPTVLFR